MRVFPTALLDASSFGEEASIFDRTATLLGHGCTSLGAHAAFTRRFTSLGPERIEGKAPE